ncbi:hypothetical protein K491DRAFT_717907 [Lophiostoma macrostomum CBS 122681]|uniref:F-box domain-containing protein n=1 Tax=Lophiostoma macrostomum CBS 122681 TaxID=1314788 RepID=A0A6A6T2T2_9PLEO|nr:hypothetical protein K491DRAFT_717907 [Lophiostoma macrostomum CBS 122681]
MSNTSSSSQLSTPPQQFGRIMAAQSMVPRGFLDLPGEIRNLIYDCICPDNHKAFRDSHENFWIGSIRELVHHFEGQKGLAQTCKQIRNEMLSRCSAQATWRAIFNVPDCYEFAYETTWPNGNLTSWTIMPGDISKLFLEINEDNEIYVYVERNAKAEALKARDLRGSGYACYFIGDHCVIWSLWGAERDKILTDKMRYILAECNNGADGLSVWGWREVIELAKDIATNLPS